MGLDMYLEMYPRYKDFRPEDIRAVDEYLDWAQDPDAKGHSLEGWCGVKEEEVPPYEDREALTEYRKIRYWAWDDEHKYPHVRIYEQVGYWRKANAIHKWFVDNVQDGEDDCEYHDEVTRATLGQLRDACAEVLESSVLVSGKIKNGYTITADGMIPQYEDGKYILNTEVCEDVLPCTSGFFFGSTDYDEWYMEDVKYTYELCNRLLESVDFDTEMLYYRSSW